MMSLEHQSSTETKKYTALSSMSSSTNRSGSPIHHHESKNDDPDDEEEDTREILHPEICNALYHANVNPHQSNLTLALENPESCIINLYTAKCIVLFLQGHKYITRLQINLMHFSSSALNELGSYLRYQTHITAVLFLGKIATKSSSSSAECPTFKSINNTDLQAFTENVTCNPIIQECCFTRQDFSNADARAACLFWLSQRHNFQVLKFHSCQFHNPHTDNPEEEAVSFLVQGLRAQESLRDFALFQCDMSDAAGAQVVHALPLDLRRLSLSWNPHLGAQTLQALQSFLRAHGVPLQSLQFSQNKALLDGSEASDKKEPTIIQTFLQTLQHGNDSLHHLQLDFGAVTNREERVRLQRTLQAIRSRNRCNARLRQFILATPPTAAWPCALAKLQKQSSFECASATYLAISALAPKIGLP